MGIYSTYREAVLANGSTNEIHTSMSGRFITQPALTSRLLAGVNEGWNLCNPADHLETLESFLASGKRLKYGDLYVELHGVVTKVISETDMNTKSSRDHKRFVLQASADQVETPEEKEAFDRIPNQTTIDAMNSEEDQESYSSASEAFDAIDTTPQQVESLNCSGKPNSAEWKNGDKVCSDGLLGVFIGLDPYSYGLCYVIEGGMDSPVLWHTNRLSKPETPAQREERERLEAAYDLYLTARSSTNDYTITFNQFCDSMVKSSFLAIVDKTGYRRQ